MQKYRVLGAILMLGMLLIIYFAPQSKPEIKGYANLLPSSTEGLLVVHSPKNLLSRFDPGLHHDILHNIQFQSRLAFGMDITDVELLENIGIDLERPIAMAFLDHNKGTVAMFVGVEETEKFWHFLDTAFGQSSEKNEQRAKQTSNNAIPEQDKNIPTEQQDKNIAEASQPEPKESSDTSSRDSNENENFPDTEDFESTQQNKNFYADKYKVTISGVPCIISGLPSAPNVVYTYYAGYWIIYGTQNLLFRENLLQQFSEDILHAESHLADSVVLQNATGDVSVYFASLLLKKIIQRSFPDAFAYFPWLDHCSNLCASLAIGPQTLTAKIHIQASTQAQEAMSILEKSIAQGLEVAKYKELFGKAFGKCQNFYGLHLVDNLIIGQFTAQSSGDILQEIFSSK